MRKKYFSKLLLVLLVMFAFIGLVACGNKGEEQKSEDTIVHNTIETPKQNVSAASDEEGEPEPLNAVVYFHYKRTNSDYDRWQLWLWAEEGDALDPEGKDDFGVYFRVDLADPTSYFYEASTFGYIYRLGEWEQKDKVPYDRFVTLTEAMIDENNEIHLYSFEGDPVIYTDKNKKQPVYEINGFILDKDPSKATITANAKGKYYKVYRNGEVFKEGSFRITNTMTVILPEKFDLANKDVYELEIQFDDVVTLKSDLNITQYYDSADFTSRYIYDGDDLGVTVKDGKTTFKLWAPASRAVSVELYDAGHSTKHETSEHPGQNTPTKSYDLKAGSKGVWSITVDEDLTGKYYTYTVTNGYTKTKDIVDPYATATGINGLRGYIANFDSLNPEGWQKGRKALYSPTELVVYELHIRDLTMDDTWNGTDAYRGKFLGMSESGTTFTYKDTTVTTGFDHIKELGVNAVQILPFFDAANKEQREDQYNWGYNPQNYNVLEGQYSTNPYDAECRIMEFKQMMKAYNDAGIEIIMDVVYNHMSGITGSSFHKIVPGYYFRYQTDGIAWNGSGCGNEVATERAMVRKYVVDSLMFWAKEYNIKGFRFDLMGLIDITTMNTLAAKLQAYDPNIVVYGEPWDAVGGSGSFPGTQKATTANAAKLKGVGMFNDYTRDKIKGNAGGSGIGWVQGSNNAGELMTGFYGSQINNELTKQVNYVTCHDNYTLADKLRVSGVSEADLGNASVLTNGIVLTSQGINFIHAGEEILRTKPIYKNNIWTGEYSHNSYNLPDVSNSLKWEHKIIYADAYNAYKDLVHLSVNQSAFHFSNASQCSNVKVENKGSGIILTVNTPNKDANDYSKIIVIYSNANGNTTYNLSGSWNVYTVSGSANVAKGQVATGTVTAGAYSMVVLYQD